MGEPEAARESGQSLLFREKAQADSDRISRNSATLAPALPQECCLCGLVITPTRGIESPHTGLRPRSCVRFSGRNCGKEEGI